MARVARTELTEADRTRHIGYQPRVEKLPPFALTDARALPVGVFLKRCEACTIPPVIGLGIKSSPTLERVDLTNNGHEPAYALDHRQITIKPTLALLEHFQKLDMSC